MVSRGGAKPRRIELMACRIERLFAASRETSIFGGSKKRKSDPNKVSQARTRPAGSFSLLTAVGIDEMKFSIQIILISVVMGGVILALLAFGFSDWVGMSPEKYELWQTKPWRPYARLAFSFISISMICVIGGMLIRSSFRNKQ